MAFNGALRMLALALLVPIEVRRIPLPLDPPWPKEPPLTPVLGRACAAESGLLAGSAPILLLPTMPFAEEAEVGRCQLGPRVAGACGTLAGAGALALSTEADLRIRGPVEVAR